MNHVFRLARSKRKRLPEGWDLIEPTLMEFEERMREVSHLRTEERREKRRGAFFFFLLLFTFSDFSLTGYSSRPSA